MSEPRNWICPFCSHAQVVTEGQSEEFDTHLLVGAHKYGEAGLGYAAIACANPNCREITIQARFTKGAMVPQSYGREYEPQSIIDVYELRPSSSSVAQPDYIPEPLREDYYEACKIRDLSPKASATLARRCIQGMIRDFCGIAGNTLFEEINTLKEQSEAGTAPKGVEPETTEAIDHVRSIGNIGAHMQRDINIIVDVDTGEAQALIELIEVLFEEWYVSRHKRDEKLAKVKKIKLLKDGVISAAKSPKVDEDEGASV